MSDLFREPDDATPLQPEERDGLKPTWITHRRDLNEAEEDNIVRAVGWLSRRRPPAVDELLSDTFVRALHKRMFGEVWAWAGRYRRTERNIGVDAWRIGQDVPALLDNVRYWAGHGIFKPDDIAVRLHHGLVFIHPFPNGNGRHARLMADLLAERMGRPRFSWGGGRIADVGRLRASYVAALRAADGHDLGPLIAFARS